MAPSILIVSEREKKSIAYYNQKPGLQLSIIKKKIQYELFTDYKRKHIVEKQR